MDIKELLKEAVIDDEVVDAETGVTCVLIPKDIFTHLLRLIPRDEEED